MSLSLYQISVPTYVQGLGGVQTYLSKGLEYCSAQGIDPASMLSTSLYDDMWALDKQVQSACHHSLGAINGLKSGVFNPPTFEASIDYDGLIKLVASTQSALQAMSEDEVNALSGKDMRFEVGEHKLEFVSDEFVLTFSFPNFFFHTTTGYDILRHRGVPIGKRHYAGRMRMKA